MNARVALEHGMNTMDLCRVQNHVCNQQLTSIRTTLLRARVGNCPT